MEFSVAYLSRRRTIGLTALIDVVFILLMFFMLTSSFEQWKTIQIDSPVSEIQATTSSVPQFIVLTSSGQLYPLHEENKAISYADLSDRFWKELDVERPLFLLPEPEVRLQKIILVIEELRAMGLEKVSIGEPYSNSEPEA